MKFKPGTPDTTDERGLALRIAGVLWASAGIIMVASIALPGATTRHWAIVAAIAGGAVAFGVVCLVMPTRWAHPLFFLIPSALALPIVAVAVAASGGAASPLGLLLFFLVAFCAYFYSPLTAIPFVIGSMVITALPLLYDPDAVGQATASRVVISAAAFAILAGVILVSKRQLVALRRHAQHLSLSDSLTGLANRRALMELLERHVGGERATDASGLLMVDIDDFKDANTLYGHPGGDTVLRAAADALRATARDGDLVARLGGDEFAVVARGADPRGMSRLAERTLHAIRGANTALDLPGFKLTASVGWALYPENASTIDELITAADMSLRGAKILGKDRLQPPVERLPDATR